MRYDGYIRLHRKSLESSVWLAGPNVWAVWCWCLMRANHTETRVPFNGKDTVLSPGQFITGRDKAALEIGISVRKYRVALLYLQQSARVSIKTTSRFSIITVLKWKDYQHSQDSPASVLTSKRPTDDQQMTTDKNVLNVLNDKKVSNTATPSVADKDSIQINKILSAFQMKLNPTIAYGNKSQRKACKELIDKFGLEKTLSTIEYAASVKDETFAPTITTPIQLREKLAQLLAYHRKNEPKSKNTMAIIS